MAASSNWLKQCKHDDWIVWDNGTNNTTGITSTFNTIVNAWTNVTSTASTTTLTLKSLQQTINQLPPMQPMPNIVVQQAPPLRQVPEAFNKYINASDLLEEFIRWLGDEGVRQFEAQQMPLEVFIKWLVIRACEEDNEEPNVVLALPAPRKQPRCIQCSRFMAFESLVQFDRAQCAARWFKEAA